MAPAGENEWESDGKRNINDECHGRGCCTALWVGVCQERATASDDGVNQRTDFLNGWS